jgi:hypothetical protein
MWILKGTFLGLWLFGFGTLALLYFAIYRHLPPHSAVGVSALAACTTHNPLWWTALVVCLVLGNAITRSWSGHPLLWIALLVSGVLPAGFLALLLILLAKLKHLSQGHS